MNRRPNQEALVAFNTRRSRDAGAVKAVAAREAWKILIKPHQWPEHSRVDAAILQHYKKALYVRAVHPEASLAECAALLGVSKDTFAGWLRRAIAYAKAVTS